jgi:hypothetical protein
MNIAQYVVVVNHNVTIFSFFVQITLHIVFIGVQETTETLYIVENF